MTDSATPTLGDAERALVEGERIPLAQLERVPETPGIYAFWIATAEARRLLGLTLSGADEPVYVGLAQRSLRTRVGEYVAATPTRLVPLRDWVEAHLLVNGHCAVGEWTMFPSNAYPGRAGFSLPFARRTGPAVRGWMQANLSISVVTASSTAAARALEMPLIDRLAPIKNQSGMKRHLQTRGFGANRFRPDAQIRMTRWDDVSDICGLLIDTLEEDRAREFDVEFDGDGIPVAIVPTGRQWDASEPLAMAAIPSEDNAVSSIEALAIWYRNVFESDEALLEAIEDLLNAMGDDNCWIPGFTRLWLSEQQWKFERSLRPLVG